MIRAAFLAIVAAAPAAAQDTETILTARLAAQALAQAAVALDDADGARDRVEALTTTVRAYEDGLSAMREGLRQAAIEERTIRLALEAKREDVMQLTGVLAGLGQGSGPLLLLHPGGPLNTVRSGMMAADVAPALQAEAEALRAELEVAAQLRLLQESSMDTLTEGLAGAQAARLALSQAIAERRELPQRLADDPEALAALLESADTLESFAAGLIAVPLAGEDARPPFRELRGTLPLPAPGAILRGFGEADAAGVERPGVVVATRPRALVTAPAAGTVRYAGPLLDYGNVIVLEPARGYLIVLAGLGTVYAGADEVVAAGAPLGLMGGTPPEAAAFVHGSQDGAGGRRSETLYIEVREDDAPVDPASWFAPERG